MQATRTFRVFVSSTFSDLKAERNALQEKVFPRLRDLAAAHGCRFQAIDLRWGVSEEAALDQQTMNICLGEITRCQKTSPRPNFIILLGDRYGWRPLPHAIPEVEFERILPVITEEEKRLLNLWYRRDDNAVPPEYCLLPRTGDYMEFTTWEKVENQIRQLFKKVIQSLPFSPNEKLKYTASATEQEIAHGALNVEDARNHVFGFFRTIEGLPENNAASQWLDLDESGKLDNDARTRLEALKQNLKERLQTNIHTYNAHWKENGISEDHVSQLCDDVYSALSGIILDEIGKLEELEPLEKEIADHAAFQAQRARFFVGRSAPLRVIEKYIRGTNHQPLVLFSESGAGKSSLMARVVDEVQRDDPELVAITRFIGATPGSTDLTTLLKSLCEQIYKIFDYEATKQQRLETEGNEIRSYVHFMYGETEVTSRGRDVLEKEFDIPDDPLALPHTFQDFLKKVPRDKRLVLFLDALDQLVGDATKEYLSWFPVDLPENVRVIASTVPSPLLSALQGRLPSANILKIEPMSLEEGRILLDLWLQDAGRKLQPPQEKDVLGKFAECGLPLYLKLAFEQACQWKSYSSDTSLSAGAPGILRDLFKVLSSESNHGATMVSHTLGYLAAARHGLTEDELLDLLSADHEVLQDFLRRSPRSPKTDRLPIVIWSRLYFDLEPYLTERSGDGTRLLAFYHRQLADVIAQDYLAGSIEGERHRALAEYFVSQPLQVERDRERMPNLRRFSELAYQQISAGLWQELEATLCDLRAIDLACGAGMTYQLLRDYRAAMNRMPNALEISSKERKGRERLTRYATDLSDYARRWSEARRQHTAGPDALPEAPPAQQLIAEETIRKEIERIVQNPTPLERLQAFSQFLNAEAHNFALHASVPMFCVQQAYNSARTGPVAQAADELIKASPGVVAFLRTASSRPSFNPHPACLRTIGGENGRTANCVAITPDGRLAFTGGYNAVHLWDIETGQCLQVLDSPGFDVAAVCISSDGKRGVSSDTKEVRIWDLELGRCIRTIPYQSDQGDVTALNMSADGSLLVTCGFDDHLRLWDAESGECQTLLVGQGAQTMNLATDEKLIVTGHLDGSLRTWSVETGDCLQTLNAHEESVGMVSLSANGQRAISAATSPIEEGDYRLFLWDLESNQCLRALQGHNTSITGASMSADGSLAMTGDYHGLIIVWDLPTGEVLRVFKNSAGEIRQLALTADGRLAVSVNESGTLSVWNIESGYQLSEEQQLAGGVVAPVIVTGGYQCFTAQRNNPNLMWWALEAMNPIEEFKGGIGQIELLCLNSNQTRALTVHEKDPDGPTDDYFNLEVWNLHGATEQMWKNYPHLRGGHKKPVYLIRCGPNKQRAISADQDGTICVWNIETGGLVHRLESGDTPHDIQISADGRFALVAGGGEGPFKVKDAFLQLWDLATGKLVREFEGHTGPVYAARFSKDGRCVISTSRDGTLRLWNVETGQTRWSLLADAGSMELSTDGTRVLSADGTLQVWDIESGQSIACLTGHKGGTHAMSLSPHGDYAMSSGWDETVRLWDVGTGKCLAILPNASPKTTTVLGTRVVLGQDMSVFDIHGLDLGMRVVTPVRLWSFGFGDNMGRWEDKVTVLCEWCDSGRFLEVEGLEGHTSFFRKLFGKKKVPSSSVSEIRCKYCGHPLKLTPFLVDNQGWARALREEEKAARRELWNRFVTQHDLGREASDLQKGGDMDQAVALYKEQERLCRELGDKDRLQVSLGNQANILYLRGDLNRAMALYKEKEHLCREFEDKDGLQVSLGSQATVHYAFGDLLTALLLYQDQERLCRELGKKAALQYSLDNQAKIDKIRGDPKAAMAFYKEKERLCRELSNKHALRVLLGNQAEILSQERVSLGNQGELLYTQGDLDSALALREEEERLCRELGDMYSLTASLGEQAMILMNRGDLDSAMKMNKEVEQLCRELGNIDSLKNLLHRQALMLMNRDDLDGAMEMYKELERVSREWEDKRALVGSLDGQAFVLEKRGDLDGAKALQNEVEHLRLKLGLPEISLNG